MVHLPTTRFLASLGMTVQRADADQAHEQRRPDAQGAGTAHGGVIYFNDQIFWGAVMVEVKRALSEGRVAKEPKVVAARTFLQIARDFTWPLDAIREAISNAIDAHATEIRVRAWEDEKMPGGELVIEVEDNGDGMDEVGLEAFFNLGDSTRVMADGTREAGYIGEKGHGTKTYFNSRQIEVFTTSNDGRHYYALMDEPLRHLLSVTLPPYDFDPQPTVTIPRGTRVVVRGFNRDEKRDFAHRVLRDYVMWFTKFATFEWIFEAGRPRSLEQAELRSSGPTLYLQGLGREGEWEQIPFGHHFPRECTALSELKKKNKDQPMRWYVKRWIRKGLPVREFPHIKLDIVFSLEGDLARREYNPMISYQGKPREEGDYTIEQRYGLWACRDWIPVRTVNDWFSKGKSEWTKFHAFVNCQQFLLTANRADINNTDPKLLAKIEETVAGFYASEIEGSTAFEDYLAAVREEEQYRNAQQEGKEFTRRKSRALKKHVAKYKGVDLLAPGPAGKGERGQEMGVHCLFAQLEALEPALFPFRSVDYDTHRGYDCLATTTSVFDLNNPQLQFVEFKYRLEPTFNHSFEHLAYVVCWECDLNDGTEVRDLAGERRILEIWEKGEDRKHRTYYLRGKGKPHNIEVVVLKDFLRDRLKLEFEPRAGST